jgi:hypothetical protein
LRLCGKFFWLLIDRLFMEKMVLTFLISAVGGTLRFFRRINTGKFGGLSAFTLLILLLWLSYQGRNK